jgi:ribosomal protein S18 acetylase RimI-like enzyme
VCAADQRPALRIAEPRSELGHQALRSYWEDIVGRYLGRPASVEEVDLVMREYPSDDLTPPNGALIVADAGGEAVGCGGVRLCADGIAELTRVHVCSEWRRRGVGAGIVHEAERHAVEHGRTRMRLDVRSDLIEARAMYARLGYREVNPFNDHPYVEHWFEKWL